MTGARNVSTVDEIRAQAEPDVIEIPGFRPGTTLKVAVEPYLRLTPQLMALGLGNPLVEAVRKQAAEGAEAEGLARAAAEGMDEKGAEALMRLLDLIARETLVEPTYGQIAVIHPLTLEQKLAIANHVLGELGDLAFFRGERGPAQAVDGGPVLEQGAVPVPGRGDPGVLA